MVEYGKPDIGGGNGGRCEWAWAMGKSETGCKALPVAIHTTFLNPGAGSTSALSRLNLGGKATQTTAPPAHPHGQLRPLPAG